MIILRVKCQFFISVKSTFKILLTMIAIVNSSLTSSKAPISSHVTSGIVAKPSLFAEGWTSRRACCKKLFSSKTSHLIIHRVFNYRGATNVCFYICSNAKWIYILANWIFVYIRWQLILAMFWQALGKVFFVYLHTNTPPKHRLGKNTKNWFWEKLCTVKKLI